MTAVVRLGETIVFGLCGMEEGPVEWSQDGGTCYKQVYYHIPFVVKGTLKEGILFVQKSYGARLKEMGKVVSRADAADPFSNAEQSLEVSVTKDFQYGQSYDQKVRFLVLHDKSRRPFQHRFFVSDAATKVLSTMSDALSAAAGVKYKIQPPNVTELTKMVVGDYLRDF